LAALNSDQKSLNRHCNSTTTLSHYCIQLILYNNRVIGLSIEVRIIILSDVLILIQFLTMILTSLLGPTAG
jgi:hypothetical protein